METESQFRITAITLVQNISQFSSGKNQLQQLGRVQCTYTGEIAGIKGIGVFLICSSRIELVSLLNLDTSVISYNVLCVVGLHSFFLLCYKLIYHISFSALAHSACHNKM